MGPSQDWGSGGDRHWRVWIVGWLELLSKAGTERAIIDGAPNLEQQREDSQLALALLILRRSLPEIDRAMVVKGFLVLGVTLI